MTRPDDSGTARDPSSSSEGLAYSGAGRKLLLVDDDAPLRRTMTQALKRRGFDVVAVESIVEARNQALAHRPQFAVLDMHLADGTGLDLVRILREIRPKVQIVIVTGYGNAAAAVAAIKAVSVDYLAKPVDADDVVAALFNGGKDLPPLWALS